MNRSRSVSRRPSVVRHRDESPSPARSRSRSLSAASSHRAGPRSRSQSRGPQARQPNTNNSASSSNRLSTSAGVLAGIGLAALVVRKLWPKAEREDRSGGGSRARRGSNAVQDQRGPRRQPSSVASRGYGQPRWAVTGGESSRVPRETERPLRSWAGHDARSHVESGSGYRRRYS